MAIDVDALAMQLIGMHLIASKLLRAPELVIGEPEAKTLAKAIKAVMAQYSINISPKAMAFYQLMAAASVVYGPRAFMIANRKAQETRAKRTQQSNAPIHPQGSQAVPGAFDTPPPPTGSMKFN